MAKTEIIGSWFNTGYHGHFRSKSRNDFMNEYRNLARPIPPSKFIQRSTAPVRQHIFSLHDNRNSFTTDALYFEQGLGRKRFKTETQAFHPDMLAWAAKKEYLDRTFQKGSVYKFDYRGHPATEMKQQIVKRPKTSFDEDYGKVTTSYRYAHGDDNPNKETLNAMCNYGLKTKPSRRLKSSLSAGRDSVASCMSWYIPRPPQKPTVPAGTQTIPVSRKITPAATELQGPPAQIEPCEQSVAPPVNTEASCQNSGLVAI